VKTVKTVKTKNIIQRIKGMNDILPDTSRVWQWVECHIMRLFTAYGYGEIRLPLLEKTELFKRSIGEATDIVEKEMYTFLDRKGKSFTLRPEGTANCVRAAIENGMLYHQQQKLWYIGPMFRYEQPQEGRYRQFYQVGVEAFGFLGCCIEAELILMTARLWHELGLASKITLQLNSLGKPAVREKYRDAFVAYCQENIANLDEDSKRRLKTNPLRILDSKNPDLQALLHNAPRIQDYLDDEDKQEFIDLCHILTQAGIQFKINPYLVRGLDYYTGTVFEWVTQDLGAQGAVCAGGRYDNLVEELGGEPTPAVGFAMGMDRIISLILKSAESNESKLPSYHPHAFFILAGEAAEQQGIIIAEQLRSALPDLILWTNCAGGNFKSQFKRADKSGARFALIIGEDELSKNMITCKDLREDHPQQMFNISALIEYLRRALRE